MAGSRVRPDFVLLVLEVGKEVGAEGDCTLVVSAAGVDAAAAGDTWTAAAADNAADTDRGTGVLPLFDEAAPSVARAEAQVAPYLKTRTTVLRNLHPARAAVVAPPPEA